MSRKTKTIAFNLREDDESQGNRKHCNDHKKRAKVKEPTSDQQPSTQANHDKRLEMLEYLKTEKPIVKKDPFTAIDDEERDLLDSLANEVIDVDKYFRAKRPKAKGKLWKIPYTFRNEPTPEGDEPKQMHRFGEGVDEGTQLVTHLPPDVSKAPVKKTKNWQDLLEEADDALDLYSHGPSSAENNHARQRRGSVLQPRHVCFSPNPEIDCGDKFVLSGLALPLRDWTSELVLNSWAQYQGECLLDDDYKLNVCKDNSLPDQLDKLGLADLRSSAANAAIPLSEAELHFYQSVRNHRRQSLVPPNFGAGAAVELSFRRQSYAGGGQLWSTNVEKNAMNGIYFRRVQLINPSFVPPNSSSSCTNESEEEEENTGEVKNFYLDYPSLDPENLDQVEKFANELTLIVRQYFVSIRDSEMINFMLHPGQQTLNSCQNIKALLHFHHRLIRLISTYIVHRESLSHSVKAILFFIRVARHLFLLDNWHSVHLVVQSLQCPPVVSLKQAWRKITFNHAEDYEQFLEIEQQLSNDNNRLGKYESRSKCLIIFEDLVERIKEVGGLKLVQITQHRLHSNWKSGKDDHIVNWISKEINDLVGQIQCQSNEPPKVEKKKVNALKRLFSWKRKSGKLKQTEEENEEHGNNNKQDFEARLLALNSMNKSMPSCRRFWSVVEINKLKSADRQPIKQDIVRTLVLFQKKAFYVFEDRDERIRFFLLSSACDHINVSMLKSKRIQKGRHPAPDESTQRQETLKIDVNKKENGDSQVGKVKSSKRVMFA